MITITTKNLHVEWLIGGNPGAIEHQEKAGQKELVESSELPRKINNYELAIPIYEKLGIKVFECGENDPLFVKVLLPKGWKIILTEHSMWNSLVDDQGRIRAMIFYKAAFYDRSAHISFRTRFRYEVVKYLEDDNDKKKYAEIHEEKNNTLIFGRVLDGDKVIYETQRDLFTEKYTEKIAENWWKNYENIGKLKATECRNWLDKRYPDWQNIYKYW